MMQPSQPRPPDRLDGGWAELRAGRWDAARAIFEAALADGEEPEALEGLSWAAWWRDDADAVFAAREHAYRLYGARGATEGAARMATWLAVDELDFHSAVPVARGWLRRARRLLAPLEPGPEHGWLAFHEGYLARVVGDMAKAERLAVSAAELGRRFGVPDLQMLGLALEGATLVACARVDEGMACLDEAAATALEGEATIPMSCAWTFCFVVSACTAVLDFERAVEWCDRIAAFAERYGSRYMLAFCRAEYGEVHLWRGRWRDAETVLEASVEDFVRTRPAMIGAPLAALAELRRRQGRPSEAGELLGRAGGSGAAQLCRARIALDRGEAREAAELLERVLRGLPEHRRLDRAPLLALLVRARVECGALGEARSWLTELRDATRAAGTLALSASADLAEGTVTAAAGEHERARTLLEDAVDRFAASGAPFETAQARLELARCLAALGRAEAADREARAAAAGLAEIGTSVDAMRAQPLPELTPREREVLGLLADGLTNPQIAERLVLSEHTVHRHVANILRKLDLPSRAAAAARAARAGLVD